MQPSTAIKIILSAAQASLFKFGIYVNFPRRNFCAYKNKISNEPYYTNNSS